MSYGLSIQAGLRWWANREVIVALVAGWERVWTTDVGMGSVRTLTSDVLSAGLRFEVARWSAFARRWWGVPAGSMALFAEPTLEVGRLRPGGGSAWGCCSTG